MSDLKMDLKIHVPSADCEVSGLLEKPSSPRALLLLGHGAGAGMSHPFMNGVSACLSRREVAVLRFQFPYMERGRRRPDGPRVAMDTIFSVAEQALEVAEEDPSLAGLPLLAGGKSFGGRMTSQAAAGGRLEAACGLVFLGFPLHPPGKPGTSRAGHLADVPAPMLFIQGTRDKLADLDLLGPVLADLGNRATLHVVEGADHGFHVLKRSGRSAEEVLDELADAVVGWIDERPWGGPSQPGITPEPIR